MAGPFTTPVAESVPMADKNARDNDFLSLNVQEGLEEIDFRRETKEPTGFEMALSIKINYDSGTNKMQIIPDSGSFVYYIRGVKKEITGTLEISVPTVEGFYVFYIDINGALSSVLNTSRGYDEAYIKFGSAYYSVIEGRVNWWSSGLSNTSMPWATQRRLNGTTGTEVNVQDFLFQNYIENGNGSLNSHAQLGLKGGRIFREDVYYTVVHNASPVNPWQQDIDSIAKIPIFYKTGTGIGFWRRKDPTSFPLIENGSGRIFYNENNAGTWQLTETPNNGFVSIYYFATVWPQYPIIGVLADKYGTSPAKSLSDTTKSLYPFPNSSFAFLNVGIFQTSTSFTNTPKARLFKITEGLQGVGTDRYMIKAEYNGNANSGRYLELSNATASDDQPLLIPEDTVVRTVTLQASSTITTGQSIAFYEIGNLVTPRFTVVVTVPGIFFNFDVTENFSKNERMVVKVLVGSINKPVVRVWLETTP